PGRFLVKQILINIGTIFTRGGQPTMAPLYPYTTLFRSAIVPAVDIAAGIVTVTPPAGLFEELPEDDDADDDTAPESTDAESTNADRKSTRLNSSHVKSSYAVFGSIKKHWNYLYAWGEDP